MKFIEKEDNVKLECGDWILFGKNALAMVIRKDNRYGVLYLSDGVCSPGLNCESLDFLERSIKDEFVYARIIKSKNIVITEV